MSGNRGSSVKWIVLGCVGALVVLTAFISIIFLVVMKATEKPEQVVKDFLKSAGNRETQAAYDHFSVPLKEAQSFDEFAAIIENNYSLFQVTDTTFSNRKVDQNGASFSGTITIAAGTKVPASFTLVRENEAWKLISYNISAED